MTLAKAKKNNHKLIKPVRPGYHSNKKHWNTIEVNGEIPKEALYKLIDHSYNLVIAKLTKKVREKYLL